MECVGYHLMVHFIFVGTLQLVWFFSEKINGSFCLLKDWENRAMGCFSCCQEDDFHGPPDGGRPYATNHAAGNLTLETENSEAFLPKQWIEECYAICILPHLAICSASSAL